MKKTKIIGVLITICLTVSALSLLALGTVSNDRDDNNRFDPAHVYEINENGQTYGSAMYAPSPDKEPDLILAEGVDGKEGYIYSSDLNADLPNNPEELLAYTAKMRKIWDNAPVGELVVARTIPLYAVDGKTVIGEFAVTIGFKDSENSEASSSLKLD